MNYVSAAGARLRIDASVNTIHFFNVLLVSDRTQEAGVSEDSQVPSTKYL